ncbi:hypothetical protein [Geoglobus ahangari]|uniref:hypothetical protein n=1 Tax=Geoglobus ahangari TaxID=113653 RepID=UPI0012EBD03F|nr:hypothetical protein [Geoglobus ahangari]
MVLVYLVFVGYLFPVFVYQVPQGTDVFTHLFYVKQMVLSNSLDDFYLQCQENQFIGYRYPFGMWLFDSILLKITGLDVASASLVVPVILFLLMLFVYRSYALGYGLSRFSVVALLLLLTTPGAVMGMLQHTPSVFVLPFLIIIIHSLIRNDYRLKIMAVLVIGILPFTHAGSFMFVLYFVVSYSFVYSLLNGRVNYRSLMYLVFLMIFYLIGMHTFPYVHNQYINKARLIVSVTELFPIPYLNSLGLLLYDNVFLKLDLMYVVLFIALVYAVSNVMVYIHIIFKDIYYKLKESISLPALFGVSSLSHTPPYWPIWLGPVHSVLALLGFLKNRMTLVMFLSIAIVVIPSAYYAQERALRELAYFRLIIPIAATFGYLILLRKIKTLKNGRVKYFLGVTLSLLFFTALVVTVVVGMYYFYPKISGERYLVTGLEWLGGVGSPDEGAASYALRHRISIYGDKIPPDVTSLGHGSELRRYGFDLRNTYFGIGSEKYVKDLYATFGVKYVILWSKVFRIVGLPPESLTIDSNTQLDKIYSSVDFFSIYRYIKEETVFSNISDRITFDENVKVLDAGDTYLVETSVYKVRLSKSTPTILFLGNRTTNLLGEGGIYDYISFDLGPSGEEGGFVTQELPFDKVIVGKNRVIYSTIYSINGKEYFNVTLEYCFFEKAIRKTIKVSNDVSGHAVAKIRYTTMYFTPISSFEFWDATGKRYDRKIYQSEDKIYIKNTKMNRLYLGNGSTLGVLTYFEPSIPFPNLIAYQGSVRYDYYFVDVKTSDIVYPGETSEWIQWLSLGNVSSATENIYFYNMQLLPYSDGKIPVSVLSLVDPHNNNASVEGLGFLRDAGLKVTPMFSIRDLKTNLNSSNLNQYAEVVLYVTREANVSEILDFIEYLRDMDVHVVGIYFEEPVYDLESLKLLADYGVSYIIAREILPPYDILFQEGYRHFRSLYLNGSDIQIVSVPLSLPKLGGALYFYPEPLSAYRALLNSALNSGDPVVLRFDSSKLLSSDYRNVVSNFTSLITSEGRFYSIPLSELVSNFESLKGVYVKVAGNSTVRSIILYNNNSVDVDLTLVLTLPNYGEKYSITNGSVAGKICQHGYCEYLIPVHIGPKQIKHIMISERIE